MPEQDVANKNKKIVDKIAELLAQPDAERWVAGYFANPRIMRSLMTSRGKDQQKRFHPYRGGNLMMLGLAYAFGQKGQHPYTDFWLTFKEAKRRGGSVRRGEKGWPILVPMVVKIDKSLPDEGFPENKRVVFRGATVFNQAQTDECDFSDIPVDLQDFEHISEGDNMDAAVCLVDQMLAMPCPPKVKQDIVGSIPRYSRVMDIVFMPPEEAFKSYAHYAKTYAHEHIHATGHADRLGRHQKGDPDGEKIHRGLEETVAELGSVFLCAEFGLQPPEGEHHPAMMDNSSRYIRSWIQQDLNKLVNGANMAQVAVDYIMNRRS